MSALMRQCVHVLIVLTMMLALPLPARAVDETEIEAFLEVTGFDVALDSIKLSAGNAPDMIGIDTREFGSEWTRLVDEVFDPAVMRDLARQILVATMDQEMLDHAMGFYGSDLGKRLVAAENASHMADDEIKTEQGDQIAAGLVREGLPRLEILKHLNASIGSEDASLQAIQEVQVRFLLAAQSAGVIDLTMDEDELRAAMQESVPSLRLSLQAGALSNSAYTYQAFSDEEVAAYADALEHPVMRRVYELMNAVQFEIMANRFEATAARLQTMESSQEL